MEGITESVKRITMEPSGSTESTAVQHPFALPELDFPKFSGENPRSWIFRCETLFSLVPVPDPNKVILAALHMESRAMKWYIYNSEDLKSIPWSEFAQKVCEKFSPTTDEIVTGFRKLSQEGTVEEYMGKFEELQYLMRCEFKYLDEGFFLACFLSGLKDVIKYQVQMLSPKSIVEAFRLARLQEKYSSCGDDDGDDEEVE